MTATTPDLLPDADAPVPLSRLLRDLCDRPDGEITIGEIVGSIGGRAFGAVLFVLAVPILLPFPPGLSAILGMPLLLIGPQLALGVRRLWLPGPISRRGVQTVDFERAFTRILPWIERIEAVSRPRMGWMFGPMGERLTGAAVTILAFVLVLPVPLGNVLPAVAVGILAFALIQRDGVLALLGTAVAIASVAVIVLAADAVASGLHHLVTSIAGA